jgi:hypothetical protein
MGGTRNRYLACQIAKIEPTFQDWLGEGSPLQWAISEIMVRRHLTSSQRAVVVSPVGSLLKYYASRHNRPHSCCNSSPACSELVPNHSPCHRRGHLMAARCRLGDFLIGLTHETCRSQRMGIVAESRPAAAWRVHGRRLTMPPSPIPEKKNGTLAAAPLGTGGKVFRPPYPFPK